MKPHFHTRAAVGAAASLTGLASLAACSSNNDLQPPSSRPPISPSPQDHSISASYQDSTYTARGVYGGAPSYMDFTITLEGGVITNIESGLMPENNDTSRGYQEQFAAAVPDEVEGKPIADLEIDVIAGASGCADGFNNALDKIREQAKTNN